MTSLYYMFGEDPRLSARVGRVGAKVGQGRLAHFETT